MLKDAIDFGELLGRQLPANGRGVGANLRRVRGAGDDRCHERIGREPAEGELEKRVPTGLRKREEGFDDDEPVFGRTTLGQACAFRRRLPLPVLAR